MTETKAKVDWRPIVMGLMAIGVSADLIGQYMAQDKTPTWQECLIYVMVGIGAWLKTAPGDVSAQQADELAAQRAHDAVQQNSLPPLDHL